MKLAISNIAWNLDEDEMVSRLMQEYGVTGVEIAPTKIWDKPLDIGDQEISAYLRFWRNRGIEVSSMQALLFGRPDLTIFQTAEKRNQTLEYLKGMIRLGGRLGAKALVFGSPRNRLVNGMPREQAEEIAIGFFGKAGKAAADHDTILCIEPNPVAYECDFITTSAEGRSLVARVNHPGFGLHLDAAGMTLSQEDVASELAKSVPGICHFHVSEPNLQPIGTGGVDHAAFARALRERRYDRWVSVEMLAHDVTDNAMVIETALKTVRKHYVS